MQGYPNSPKGRKAVLVSRPRKLLAGMQHPFVIPACLWQVSIFAT